MGILGSDLTSKLGAGGNLLGAGSAAGGLLSALRSGDLPAGGEMLGDLFGAVAQFKDDANSNDWRVRLSLPTWPSFRTSPVFKPLKESGGLIFPYTPSIQMQSSAKYSPISTIHSNYNFNAFQNSDPGTITITAPMNVEDQTQGIYWVAAMHYLRSLTKMFTGLDPKAGNPPPIVMLNGYGNYVFKNVPVVVTSFQTTLDDKCDYIGVPVVGSKAGAVQGLADSVGGLAGQAGGLFGGAVGGIMGSIGNIAGGVGQVAALAGTFGVGGSISGGITHVPTKSSFTVTLQPMYSKNSAKNFSLDRFVQGGYLNNGFGYI